MQLSFSPLLIILSSTRALTSPRYCADSRILTKVLHSFLISIVSSSNIFLSSMAPCAATIWSSCITSMIDKYAGLSEVFGCCASRAARNSRFVVPSLLVLLLLAEHTTATRECFAADLSHLSPAHWRNRESPRLSDSLYNIGDVLGEFANRSASKLLHNPASGDVLLAVLVWRGSRLGCAPEVHVEKQRERMNCICVIMEWVARLKDFVC